jgi:hypothetical protein
MEGKKAKERIKRYGFAYSRAGAPSNWIVRANEVVSWSIHCHVQEIKVVRTHQPGQSSELLLD